MRKFVVVAALLLGVALLGGTPAKAELGCACAKLGQPLVCTSGVTACNTQVGGVCVFACDYQAPKKKVAKAKPKKKKTM
ncbi:MAG: hypothetical protein ACK4UO_19585 [Pseudolabrys sp.]